MLTPLFLLICTPPQVWQCCNVDVPQSLVRDIARVSADCTLCSLCLRQNHWRSRSRRLPANRGVVSLPIALPLRAKLLSPSAVIRPVVGYGTDVAPVISTVVRNRIVARVVHGSSARSYNPVWEVRQGMSVCRTPEAEPPSLLLSAGPYKRRQCHHCRRDEDCAADKSHSHHPSLLSRTRMGTYCTRTPPARFGAMAAATMPARTTMPTTPILLEISLTQAALMSRGSRGVRGQAPALFALLRQCLPQPGARPRAGASAGRPPAP